MKTRLLLFLLLSFTLNANAEHKYGLFAASDEEALKHTAEPDVEAVILGCIYADEKKGDGWDLNVTVVESYKGKLKSGDRIFVAIVAEQGPNPKEVIGTLRFFLLKSNSHHIEKPLAGAYWCDFTDNLSYLQYGESLRKLFREGVK